MVRFAFLVYMLFVLLPCLFFFPVGFLVIFFGLMHSFTSFVLRLATHITHITNIA